MKVEYNNLYTHFILTTFQRQRVIKEEGRVRIEKYITGIVNHNSSKLYAIFANPEHVHLLVSRAPFLSEEELITIIGESSEKFINLNNLVNGHFKWQQTVSAFSVSKSAIDDVCKYILNQPEHHKTKSFEEEYQEFIKYYENTIKNKV